MEEIVKNISGISGKYSSNSIFDDWIRMFAISISNQLEATQNDIWRKREADYIATSKKYNEKELEILCKCSGILIDLFQEEIKDYLGEIYMKCESGNGKIGQFFTPSHISELTADVLLNMDLEKLKSTDEKVILSEPSSGGRRNDISSS